MILGIYGSGGSGGEIHDIAELQDIWERIIFIDDTVEKGIYKGRDRMPFEQFNKLYGIQKTRIIIAQGEPKHKVFLFNKVKEKGYLLANLIHPSAYVSSSAQLGEGIVIQANAFVSCDTKIGDNVHIMQSSIITHDCIIHKHCQISMGVVIGGCSEVGKMTYVGINAAIRDKVKVGNDTIIGMGANVLKDIPDNAVAYGNPAKIMMNKNNKKVFVENLC